MKPFTLQNDSLKTKKSLVTSRPFVCHMTDIYIQVCDTKRTISELDRKCHDPALHLVDKHSIIITKSNTDLSAGGGGGSGTGNDIMVLISLTLVVALRSVGLIKS